jgi:DNA-binding transcriptional LysR family regulator
MTTERLFEFTMLANTLNFSKAAQKLYITQPVLSRHIMEMEQELGVLLFYRNTHGIALTDAGNVLLRDSKALLHKAAESTSRLGNLHTEINGIIRIACSEQVLTTQVLDFLKHFQKKYPDILLQLEPVATGTPKVSIRQYDLYFTPCDFSSQFSLHLDSCFLISQSALVLLPPHHHFDSTPVLSLEALAGETLLVPFSDELYGPYAQLALLVEKYTDGNIKKIGVPSAGAAILMVELGQGIAIIPHHLKQRVYGQTRAIPILNPECKFDIFLYYNKQPGNSAAELFYEKAVQFFQTKD